MASLHEMTKVFITAKVDMPLGQLLHEHLSARFDPSVILSSGGVWKEKKRVYDPHLIIKATETVKVHTSTFQGKTYILDKRDIVFENTDFLVVYKPPDLNVHQVPSSFFYNLTHAVNRYLDAQGTAYPSTPLTRLDRPVEGLVIFSKNKNYERRLFDLIQRRKIHKWYVGALEKGNRAPCIRIRDRIIHNGNRTVLDPNGKNAHSLFVKVKSCDFADIYSIFIFTGRRHQIRFHASQYLSPIIGDWFYGSSTFLQKDEIALMCRGYNIPYKKETLKIRLPDDYIARFYERIKKVKYKI